MIESGVIMPSNIVRVTRTCQGFAHGETTYSGKYVEISGMIDPPEVISARLIALRKACDGLNQTQFAESIGIAKNTLNGYETGKKPLTFETACLIRRRWGVPTDWLFWGDMGHEASALIRKIGRVPYPAVNKKVRQLRT
jgi:DNA-binding XRE family transcriptional regulator